jgi:predicted transposase YdaD
VAKRFDATIKHLVETHPADWIAFARLPLGKAIDVVDGDVSSASAMADKVIRVMSQAPYIAHFEFQSASDPDLDERILFYNVLLRRRHRLPVRSVAILLRPQAQPKAVTGGLREAVASDAMLEFRYRLIRVWETPVESVLAGGLGTLPLAPISAADAGVLPEVIGRMTERLDRESSTVDAADAWTATFVLLGLRYPPEVGIQLLKGVRRMKESSTYQWIVEEGLTEGIAKGMERGIEKGMEVGLAQGRAEGLRTGSVGEAKSLLLRIGRRRFGAPPAAVLVALDAITDLSRIEIMAERLIDASGWTELLETRS